VVFWNFSDSVVFFVFRFITPKIIIFIYSSYDIFGATVSIV
jgi:hypothetical protein